MATLVMVADASRARFFSAETAMGGLTEIDTMVHPESKLHPSEMASDKPGRTSNRSGQGVNSLDTEVDPKRQEAIRFAKEVSHRLDMVRQQNKYSRLYVVAAPTFLGMLRNNLHSETKKWIAGEINKDLTALSVIDIRTHLPERL
ncbi:MAG TPA: host attachment protein [Gammaproteobacteria bacterium]